MAFMTYEDTPFHNLQDQSGLRAAFNLARDLHEDLALKSDKHAKELSTTLPDNTPVISARQAYENVFNNWIRKYATLTSLQDISEDLKTRSVIVDLLEGTWVMAHNDTDGLGSVFKDMRAAAASSTSSAFYNDVITEIEGGKMEGDNPLPSVAQAEHRIIDTKFTLEMAQLFTARGKAFKEFQRITLHPAEYKNWTKTIEGFDKHGADGIPASLYAQAETAVNNLRAMKAQFTPDVK